MKRRFLSLLTILVKDERMFAVDNEFDTTRKSGGYMYPR